MQRMPPDPRFAGQGMQSMNFGRPRFRPGTILPVETLQDVTLGSCVIARASKFGCTSGVEYTITNYNATAIEVTNKRRQRFKIKPYDFVTMFDHRVGPFVEEALRPGVAIRAFMDGATFRTGEILTLQETGGSVFGAVTQHGDKRNVKKQEVLTAFEFV